MEERVMERTVPKDLAEDLDCKFTEVKFLNLVKMQELPFDKNYEPEQSILYVNQHGSDALKQFNLENVIWWRLGEGQEISPETLKTWEQLDLAPKDANESVESNTRLIEWSDGTKSLVIGDEMFNLDKAVMGEHIVALEHEDLLLSKGVIEEKT